MSCVPLFRREVTRMRHTGLQSTRSLVLASAKSLHGEVKQARRESSLTLKIARPLTCEWRAWRPSRKPYSRRQR